MKKTEAIDWSVPQRQPASAIFILVIQTFWEVVKRAWPILLLPLLRSNDEGGDRMMRYEIYGIILLAITLAGGMLKYLFFRFYILNEELIVKKGWLKKQTIVIPLNRIQTVNLEQPMLHQVLNLVKVTVDTPGSDSTEVTIDSLRRPMAEDLRSSLLHQREIATATSENLPPAAVLPVIRVSSNDMLRLSLSANHLETFFVIMAFGLSLYDDLSDITGDFIGDSAGRMIPQQTFGIVLFMVIATLLITMLISTIRIVLKFYNLSVYTTATGFRITSGLTTLKERVVATSKVQFVSWRASWIRRLFNLRLFRFHLPADIQKEAKADLPVTRLEFLDILTREYYPVPDTAGKTAIRMHPSYVFRRTLLVGLLPVTLAIAIAWTWLQELSLLGLLYPLVVFLFTWLHTRKFRLFAFDEVVLIQKGLLGKEELMLKWFKLQSVEIKQSIYQRRKGLAMLVFHVAGARIAIRHIPLEAARQVANYALYKVESSREPWM